MTTDAPSTTVRCEITLNVPIERAFKVFIERFDEIKPHDHNLLAVPIAESIFEPRVGGRVYDRGVDGSECQWGRVLAYEPPNRLLFTWDISPRWQIESDHSKASEVEIRFFADDQRRTRVELEHRHLDRHGENWPSLADGVRGSQGWPLYLDRFAAAAA
jgi:uncharacterized protein YndB with AHSA1/START domain